MNKQGKRRQALLKRHKARRKPQGHTRRKSGKPTGIALEIIQRNERRLATESTDRQRNASRIESRQDKTRRKAIA